MYIEDPKEFAIRAHGNQKYGDKPYIVHLEQVVDVCKEFIHCISGCDDDGYIDNETVEAASWLHDVLEDCNTTYEELQECFGNDVASLVSAVTDEPGKNRKERKAKTLPKIRRCGCLAVAIKLCDRIANVRNCISSNNRGLMKMYRKEHDSFKLALYKSEDILDPMWECLEELIS